MSKQQNGMGGGTLGKVCFYFHVGYKVGSYAKTAGYMASTQSSGRKNIKGFPFFLKKNIYNIDLFHFKDLVYLCV